MKPWSGSRLKEAEINETLEWKQVEGGWNKWSPGLEVSCRRLE
jgi:hypothetical protein